MTETPNSKPKITVECIKDADPKIFTKNKNDIVADANNIATPIMIDERFVPRTQGYSIH